MQVVISVSGETGITLDIQYSLIEEKTLDARRAMCTGTCVALVTFLASIFRRTEPAERLPFSLDDPFQVAIEKVAEEVGERLLCAVAILAHDVVGAETQPESVFAETDWNEVFRHLAETASRTKVPDV